MIEPVKPPTVSEAELTRAESILNTLGKTLKIFTTYPPNNPIYKRFSAELNNKFNLFFNTNENMVLKIEQLSLTYKEKEIYFNPERNDNIAFMLYMDGIKEVCFFKGITEEEIIDFINILRIVSKKTETLDDDMVTLLWEKDLPHITYFAPELEKTSKEQIDALTPEKIDFQTKEIGIKIIPPSPEELYKLKDKASGMEGNHLLFSGFQLFTELLLLQKNNLEKFKEISRNIGVVLDFFLERNAIDEANTSLKKLLSLLETDLSVEAKQCGSVIIDKAGEYEVLKNLADDIRQPEVFKRYLLNLNKNAVGPLMDLLAEQKDQNIKSLFMDVLAVLGKKDLETLAKGLISEDNDLIIITIKILAMVKEPIVINYLEKSLKNKDHQIRKETIKGLGLLAYPEIKKPLLPLLKDTEPANRIAALKILRKIGGNDIFDLVKRAVNAEDFKDKSFNEKKEFLESLGELNKTTAFPILSELFNKKSFFMSASAKELRACAAYGLGMVGSAEAFSLLEKEKESKDDLLQEACRKALRSLTDKK